MCGVLGIYNLDGKNINKENAFEMLEKMSHRGPDGLGSFFDKEIALLHRRLSILDVSDLGKQPMHSKDEKWVITFNGCIYNFKELKSDLESHGHKFISTSDTEVISEGFSRYGVDFVKKKFNGMFAIGAWNAHEKKLYLIRDRYGIKPLYYWFNGKTLVFASEIKSIIEHRDYKIDVDLNALNEYFTFQNIFSYNTLLKMLPCSHQLISQRYLLVLMQ